MGAVQEDQYERGVPRTNQVKATGVLVPPLSLLPVRVEIETGEIEMIKEAPIFEQA